VNNQDRYTVYLNWKLYKFARNVIRQRIALTEYNIFHSLDIFLNVLFVCTWKDRFISIKNLAINKSENNLVESKIYILI